MEIRNNIENGIAFATGKSNNRGIEENKQLKKGNKFDQQEDGKDRKYNESKKQVPTIKPEKRNKIKAKMNQFMKSNLLTQT